MKKSLNLLAFLMWIAIILQTGCGCSPRQAQQLTLEQILREEVKKAKNTANSTPSTDGKQTIIEVAAKAFGLDGQGRPHGKLIIYSETKEGNGHRKFVASWQRTRDFKLEPPNITAKIQEIVWLDEDGTSGATIDLKDIQADQTDIIGRLKEQKNYKIAQKDPLQQVLTLSGYADIIRITALPEGKYHAEIETERAEIVVDDTTLISANLHK